MNLNKYIHLEFVKKNKTQKGPRCGKEALFQIFRIFQIFRVFPILKQKKGRMARGGRSRVINV